MFKGFLIHFANLSQIYQVICRHQCPHGPYRRCDVGEMTDNHESGTTGVPLSWRPEGQVSCISARRVDVRNFHEFSTIMVESNAAHNII